MTRPAVTIEPTAAIDSAVALMKARRVRHLPVVWSDGRLAGIVSDRDLRQVVFDPSIQEALGITAEALKGLCVRDVMTWGVVAVRADSSLREAAALMYERKIGALPVVRNQRVVGMLTEQDVLRAFEDQMRRRLRRVRPMKAQAPHGGEYDYGFVKALADDPWRNEAGTD